MEASSVLWDRMSKHQIQRSKTVVSGSVMLNQKRAARLVEKWETGLGGLEVKKVRFRVLPYPSPSPPTLDHRNQLTLSS